MFISTLIMGILAGFLLIIGYFKGQQITGSKLGLCMMTEILPLLVFAFIIAAMIQVLVPAQLLSCWIGQGSRIKGILIGTVAGDLLPAGPYISLPIVPGLLRSGAGVGTMVAFLISWSLWAVSRLSMEVGILGWRFTFIPLASPFFFLPLAGLIAQALFRG